MNTSERFPGFRDKESFIYIILLYKAHYTTINLTKFTEKKNYTNMHNTSSIFIMAAL